MLDVHPPARRLRLNCNDPEAWRYRVLRNGERVSRVRNADAVKGLVEVFRYIAQVSSLDPTKVITTQMVVGHDKPESERFETMTPGDVEIIRFIPPAGEAAWDADPIVEPQPVEFEEGDALAEPTMLLDEPEEAPVVIPPAPRVEPLTAERFTLALDFG